MDNRKTECRQICLLSIISVWPCGTLNCYMALEWPFVFVPNKMQANCSKKKVTKKKTEIAETSSNPYLSTFLLNFFTNTTSFIKLGFNRCSILYFTASVVVVVVVVVVGCGFVVSFFSCDLGKCWRTFSLG